MLWLKKKTVSENFEVTYSIRSCSQSNAYIWKVKKYADINLQVGKKGFFIFYAWIK